MSNLMLIKGKKKNQTNPKQKSVQNENKFWNVDTGYTPLYMLILLNSTQKMTSDIILSMFLEFPVVFPYTNITTYYYFF